MRFDLFKVAFALIFAALLLCGCVQVDIDERRESVSIGQQLTDLNEAREQGLISDRE